MPSPIATLPFILKRSSDEITPGEYRSTTETAHGLLRLEPDRLVMQWRTHRATATMGAGYAEREEMDPMREVEVPLAWLAHAELVRRWRWLWPAPCLVVTASDLRAFESVSGPDGLALANPSRLELRLARSETDAGREFAGELALAISERQLRLAEERTRGALPPAP